MDVGSFADVSEILATLTTLFIFILKKEVVCTSETPVALGISSQGEGTKLRIAVMLCTCTAEVLCSNLGRYIVYPGCDFLQSLRPYTSIALRLSHDHFLPNPRESRQ